MWRFLWSEQVLVFIEKIPPAGDWFVIVVAEKSLHPVVMDCSLYLFGMCGHPSFSVFGLVAGWCWELVRQSFEQLCLDAAPIIL